MKTTGELGNDTERPGYETAVSSPSSEEIRKKILTELAHLAVETEAIFAYDI